MAGRSSDTSTASHAVSVTKDDTTVLPKTRALYIGTSGDVAVRMAQSGVTITFKTVPVGTLSVQVDKVLSTGTTAAEIIALY